MNSCCTPPLHTIAADQHHDEESCCVVTEKTAAPAKAVCPVSGRRSGKIQRCTLEHLLKPGKADALRPVQYYYCNDPNCKVVYFSNEQAPYFTTDDLAVRVFAKDPGDEVPVCYCFNWTRARLFQEIRDTGQSTAVREITREIKADNCHCDITNPKGACCLGDVKTLVKEILRAQKSSIISTETTR